jgi:hypothetical protein
VTFALIFLALVVLGALLYREKAHDRERQEILAAAQKDRADLLDRLHTTAADQVAAVVRSIPPPAKSEPAVDDFVFALDDDLRLLEPTD